MGKLVMIVAIFLTSISYGFAQGNDYPMDNRENIEFGVKGGLNYSNVYDSKGADFNADPKLGFAAGMFLAIPINKYIGIQPEILLSQKGFKASGTLLGSPYDLRRTTTFIDIPLQFALKPSEFFTLLVGPQFSYLVHQRDVFTSSLTSFAQEKEFQNDNVRKNILGIVSGIDINLRHVKLGARVAWDISNNNGDGTSSTPRYKNTVAQATIGFAF